MRRPQTEAFPDRTAADASPPFFDFHTHRLDTPPGTGIVSLPQGVVLGRDVFSFHPEGYYAAGIHPWWTAEADFSLTEHLAALERLLSTQPRIVQLGECGLDRLRGAAMEQQLAIFRAQAELSERYERPMTLHIVRAFAELLSLCKQLRPRQRWTVHGFRGKPALAQQLLAAGLDLSFGQRYDAQSYALCPPERRHHETDSL